MIDEQRLALLIAEKVREIATRQGRVPFLKGDLRKSIVVQPAGRGAVVGSNLPYARAVHDGRPALTIRAKPGKALAFWAKGKGIGKRGQTLPLPSGEAFKKAAKSGDVIVVKKVHQRARKARPFLREAVEVLRQEGLGFLHKQVRQDVVRELERALRR